MDGNLSESWGPDFTHALPNGFVAQSDGIYVEQTDKDDEITLEWLSSPIVVKALGRSTENEGWCRWIEVIDSDGVVHVLHVPEKDIAGSFSKVLSELAHRGFTFRSGSAARRSIAELLVKWKPKRRYFTTDRLGWVDKTCKNFVLGNQRVVGDAEMVFLNDGQSTLASEMRPSGNLAEWRDTVLQLCSGNPIMVAAVSLAFAGPLVGFLGRESFGLHLRGQSGCGKTTTAKIALSVWGGPEFKHGWRTTDNALEATAAACNGSLLVLDEIAEVTGRDVDQAVYMLGNGLGKARSTSTGQRRALPRWSLTILSTGEISLAEKMAEVGKSPMAGQSVRLLDTAADIRRFGAFDELHGVSDRGIFAKSAESAAATCFGVAGSAFVERLIQSEGLREKMASKLNTVVSKWKSDLDLPNDGTASRVIGHFSLIGIAGHLATKWGLVGWKPAEAINAAFELAKEWVDAKDRPKKASIDASVTRTREYLEAYGDTCFQRAGQPPLADLAGYRDDDWLYILSDSWSKIHAGFIPNEAAHHLGAAGLLLRGDGNNIKCKTPAWVPGRPRAYKVKAEILKATSSLTAAE